MVFQCTIILALTLALHGVTIPVNVSKSAPPLNSTSLVHQNVTMCPSVWYKYNHTVQECQCIPLMSLDCEGEHAYTTTQSIVTYNSDKEVISATNARYTSLSRYNTTSDGRRVLLPNNLSKLNEYICGPMNREDYMCGKCKTGFGPAVMLQSMPCADVCYFCKDT